jgi:hypothetical protein
LIADFKNVISIDLPEKEIIVVQAIDKAEEMQKAFKLWAVLDN